MRKIILGAAALLTLAFTGCDGAEKLASEIEGTWTSAPSAFVASDGAEVTAVDIFTFERDSISNGGEVMVSSMVSVAMSPGGPVNLSAAAKSFVSGKWTATDRDDIIVTIDPATLTVEIDPEAVVVSSVIDAGTTPLDSVKTHIAAGLKNALSQSLLRRYLNYQKLDDVKVKGKMLEFEAEDRDCILHRQ